MLLLILGLALLLVGADLLVRGAVRWARVLRVPPLAIGLTVVAFGTSAPELAVSLRAAIEGKAELAVGNVVGSNVFNVLFILGISALVAPLSVSRRVVRIEIPLVLAVSVLVAVLVLDGDLGRIEGWCLLALGIAYTVFQLRLSGSAGEEADRQQAAGWRFGAPLAVVGGLLLLFLGSRWLVDGAVATARAWGLGERVIGLTLVAAGTSLPEVAASLVAALRGERDLAVGNVLGSNLFNLLVVLGSAAAVGGEMAFPAEIWRIDLPVMLVATFACLPIAWTGQRISRLEGGLLLAAWLLYTVLLLAPGGA